MKGDLVRELFSLIRKEIVKIDQFGIHLSNSETYHFFLTIDNLKLLYILFLIVIIIYFKNFNHFIIDFYFYKKIYSKQKKIRQKENVSLMIFISHFVIRGNALCLLVRKDLLYLGFLFELSYITTSSLY